MPVMFELLGVALLIFQEQPPPSPVTYDPPALSSVRGTYECPGRTLRIVHETRAWPSGHQGRVTIADYRSGHLRMPAQRLAEWNAQLEPIKLFRTIEVRCQASDRALITIIGNEENGSERRVVAAVTGQDIRFLPRAPR